MIIDDREELHPLFRTMIVDSGICTLLLHSMLLTMQGRGIQEFCLDNGYPTDQQIWTKRFGPPDYWLKDYRGEGFDHMIWRKRVKDMTISFRL